MAPILALAPACYSFAIRSPGVSPRITKPAYKRPLEVDGEFLITGFSAVTLQIPKQTSSNAIAFFHSRMLSSRKIADSTAPNTGIRKLKTVTTPTGLNLSNMLHNEKADADNIKKK